MTCDAGARYPRRVPAFSTTSLAIIDGRLARVLAAWPSSRVRRLRTGKGLDAWSYDEAAWRQSAEVTPIALAGAVAVIRRCEFVDDAGELRPEVEGVVRRMLAIRLKLPQQRPARRAREDA